MTDYLTRWFMNANANALGDSASYEAGLRAWRPAAQQLMNGLDSRDPNNTVVRMNRIINTWGGITVYRHYEQEFEGHPWERKVSDEIAMLKRFGAPYLWYTVGNEPKPDGEAETRFMCKWFADLIEAAVPEGLCLVLWNGGVGTFERWQVDAGWYDDLLLALVKYVHRKTTIKDAWWPQFVLGSHSAAYWHGVPMVHCAGRNPEDLIHPERLKRETWPTREQIFDADTSDNWILFRDWWLIERARKLAADHHIHEGEDIQIIVTEAGTERLPNIVKGFPDVARKMDAICGRETRGAPTIVKYLEWALGMSGDEALCECFWFVESSAPLLYRAFLWFSWTVDNAEPDKWDENYGAQRMAGVIRDYPGFVMEHTKESSMVTLPAQLFPSISDPAMKPGQFKSTGNYTFVRERASKDSAEVCKLSEATVKYIPPPLLADEVRHTETLADGKTVRTWIPIYLEVDGVQKHGWVGSDAVIIQPLPEGTPPAAPSIPPAPDMAAIFKSHRDMFMLLITDTEKARAGLVAQVGELTAQIEALGDKKHSLDNQVALIDEKIAMYRELLKDYDTFEKLLIKAA